MLKEDLLYSYALRHDPRREPDNLAAVNYGMTVDISNVKNQLTDPNKSRGSYFTPGLHYDLPVNPKTADQNQLFAMLNSLKPYDDLPGFGKEMLADTDLDGVSDQLVQQTYTGAVSELKMVEYASMGGAIRNPQTEQQLEKAIRLLKAEKPGEAIALLDAIGTQNNTLYQGDLEWYTALAWLIRQPVKGKNRLEKIADNPLQTHRLEARGLLFKIGR